jgi:hypothetical protein
MAKRYLQIDAGMLLVPDFSDADSFYRLIQDLIFYLPGYQPQLWTTSSDERSRYSLMELRSLTQRGETVLRWRRNAHPRAEGSMSRRIQTPACAEHAAHRLRISVKDDEQMGWLVSFLCFGAASDGIDFAWCDVDGFDCGNGASRNLLVQKENCISTQRISRGMPDLFWAQIFGRAFVDLFGLDKLLSSPAYQVEQLTPDAVYVQLTESIFDVRDRPAEVHARKQLVKRHLDDNIFLDSSRPSTHVYRKPVFAF